MDTAVIGSAVDTLLPAHLLSGHPQRLSELCQISLVPDQYFICSLRHFLPSHITAGFGRI